MDRIHHRSPFLGPEGRQRVHSAGTDGGTYRPLTNGGGFSVGGLASGGSTRSHLAPKLIDALDNKVASPASPPQQTLHHQHPFGATIRSPLASPVSTSFFSAFQQSSPMPSHPLPPRSHTVSNGISSSNLANEYTGSTATSVAQNSQHALPRATRSNSSGRSSLITSHPPQLRSPEPYAQASSPAAPLQSPFDAPEGFGPPRRSTTAGASFWDPSAATGPASPSRDIWRQQGKEAQSLFRDLNSPSRQNSGSSDASIWLSNDIESSSSTQFKAMDSLRSRGAPARAATVAFPQSLNLSETDDNAVEPVLTAHLSTSMTAALGLEDAGEVRSASPSTVELDRGTAISSAIRQAPPGPRRAVFLQGVRAPQRAATLDPSSHLPRSQQDSSASPLRAGLSPVADSSDLGSTTSPSPTLATVVDNSEQRQGDAYREQQVGDVYAEMYGGYGGSYNAPFIEVRGGYAAFPHNGHQSSSNDTLYLIQTDNLAGEATQPSSVPSQGSQYDQQFQSSHPAARPFPGQSGGPYAHSGAGNVKLTAGRPIIASRPTQEQATSSPLWQGPEHDSRQRDQHYPQHLSASYTRNHHPDFANQQLYHSLSRLDLNRDATYNGPGVHRQHQQTGPLRGRPSDPIHAYTEYAPSSKPPHLHSQQLHLSHLRSIGPPPAIIQYPSQQGQYSSHLGPAGATGGGGGAGSRSVLLEDFRQRRAAAGAPAMSNAAGQQGQRLNNGNVFATSSNDPTANWVLDDIRGHVVEFCMDQHGSRFAQDRLDHASRDQVNWVFEEIRPVARTLMQDVFGNYVVQKMFEYGSNDQRLSLTEEVRTYVVPLSLSTYGCRVIQKALDYLPDSVRLDLAEELRGHVLEMVQDQNANHVVQKLLSVVEKPAKIRFIPDTFHGRVLSLGAHCYSCRVLQRIFERCGQAQARPLLEELHQSSEVLMADQYGNYVIQWILQRGMPQDKMRVIETVMGKVLPLSRHKFASNVVEQVVRAADKTQLRRLVSEILEPASHASFTFEPEASVSSTDRAATIMMTDQYANYVLQRFIELCEADQKMKLVAILQPGLVALRRGAAGPGGWTKHLAAVERLVGEAFGSSAHVPTVGGDGLGGVYRGHLEDTRAGTSSPARGYGGGGGGGGGTGAGERRNGRPYHGTGHDIGVI